MDLIKKFTDEYSNYLRDESRTIGFADFISFPKTENEVSEILSYCYENNLQATVQGARTGLAGGASPLGGLIINTSKMNKILGMRYEKETNTYYMRIQPGVLLVQVRKALENKNIDTSFWNKDDIDVFNAMTPGELFFPPDPTEPTASIGGMASCNASGSRSFMYGPTRDHIEGLNVVFADGKTTHLKRNLYMVSDRKYLFPLTDGTMVSGLIPDFETTKAKDAGYYIHPNMDVLDLFIGSQGTLGVITEIEIKLSPAPKFIWGVTAFLPDDYASINYVRLLRGEKLKGKPTFHYRPAAIEFFDKMTLDMLERQKKITPAFEQLQELPKNYSSAIYVEFNEMNNNNQISILTELSELLCSVGGNPDDTWVAENTRALEKLIFFRHAVPECVNLNIDKNRESEPSITILSADMSVPDEYIVDVYEMYHNDLKNRTKDWIIFGHIGENHYHPDIFAHNKKEYQEGYAIFEEWAAKVREMGGTITGEHGAGKLKAGLAKIMYGDAAIEKLYQFKLAFDPKSMLNPGNIFGDLTAAK